MINTEEALRRIKAAVRILPSQRVKLADALGTTLAGHIVADMNLPPFANSSMDGFAVRAIDLKAARTRRPVQLAIVGESSAGNPFTGKVRIGSAVRIMTGGKLPAGADAVVPLEVAQEVGGTHARFKSPVRVGQNIRKRGEDARKGERVLMKGQRIGPAQVSVLAALGRLNVAVYRSPKVNILATGDELVDAGRRPVTGQIRNSSSHALAAYVHQAGGTPRMLGIARDKYGELGRKLQKGLDTDILLVIGGVSVGKYDLVANALQDLGVTLIFWKANIKPGKPLLFGKRKNTLVFGLPGNPVSTAVTFLQFVQPAMQWMMGREPLTRYRASALLEQDFSKSDGKRHFLRGVAGVRNGTLRVRLAGSQSSGVMSTMARANALIIIPEDVTSVRRGESVEIDQLE